MATDIAVKLGYSLGGIGGNLSHPFLYVMRLRDLICACLFLVPIGCFASDNTAVGFLEGRLRILASKDVELAEGTPSKFGEGNYAEYPLIVLSADGKREIARVTADENGNYRVALPPGDYILDVQGRPPQGHVRARPQRFTVASNQIAHVDMDIDTGIR
jgi:hypothetical protein